MNKLAPGLLFVASLWLGAAAAASDFDGSKTLLCVPGEAVDCLARGDCW